MAMSSRAYFAELWDGLAEDRFLEPNVEEDWSLKDIIAHVASWESWMCKNLATAVSGDTPTIPQSDDDIDRMNAEFTAENGAKPLTQVMAEFAENETKIEAAITAVSAEALLENDYYDWRNGRALWVMVGANTFWHYREHTEFIALKLQSGRVAK